MFPCAIDGPCFLFFSLGLRLGIILDSSLLFPLLNSFRSKVPIVSSLLLYPQELLCCSEDNQHIINLGRMRSCQFLPLDWSSVHSWHHFLGSLGLHSQLCSGTSFAHLLSLTAQSLLFCCAHYCRAVLYLVPWFQNIVSTKPASDFLAGTQHPEWSGSNLIF